MTHDNSILDTILIAIMNILYLTFTYIASLFIGEKDVVILLLILITIDTITGIMAAKKEGRRIRSIVFFNGIGWKILLLFITLLIAIIIEHRTQINVLKWFVLLATSGEAMSIRENIIRWKDTDILNYFTSAFSQFIKLKDKFKTDETTDITKREDNE